MLSSYVLNVFHRSVACGIGYAIAGCFFYECPITIACREDCGLRRRWELTILSEIKETLVHLCVTNSCGLECIEKIEIEPYIDASGVDLPIMVSISANRTLVGKADVEDQICDLLLDSAKLGYEWKTMVKEAKQLPFSIVNKEPCEEVDSCLDCQ
jgi:hypothetical protein